MSDIGLFAEVVRTWSSTGGRQWHPGSLSPGHWQNGGYGSSPPLIASDTMDKSASERFKNLVKCYQKKEKKNR